MTEDRPQEVAPANTVNVAVLGVLGIWSAVLILPGAMNMSEPWGSTCLVTGAVALVATIVGGVSRSWMGALYAVLLATAGGMIATGIVVESDYGPALIGAGLVGLLVVGATIPIAVNLKGSAASGGSSSASPARMEQLLNRLIENSVLSDNAKRVLFRDRELELLRHAIEEDIHQGDYDAAIALCEEMANQFGYREEAEEFRTRIIRRRQEHYEAHVQAALERFETMLLDRNWAAVHDEAARIRRLFPDSHLVSDLDQRIMRERSEHRQELEAIFLDHAERDDVEAAMETLRQLDRYVSRDDAERLNEVAQTVIVKHRDNLGVQFKMAVNDHRWAEAARLGDTIIEEFPNTKMASEVRSMIEMLRTRATQAAVISEGT